MSYHGRTSGYAAKGSLSRSWSHKDATTTAPSIHTFSRSTSKGAAAPIIFTNSSGLLKPPAMEKQLECTLEELCFGCVKKVAITRDTVKPNGYAINNICLISLSSNQCSWIGKTFSLQPNGRELESFSTLVILTTSVKGLCSIFTEQPNIT